LRASSTKEPFSHLNLSSLTAGRAHFFHRKETHVQNNHYSSLLIVIEITSLVLLILATLLCVFLLPPECRCDMNRINQQLSDLRGDAATTRAQIGNMAKTVEDIRLSQNATIDQLQDARRRADEALMRFIALDERVGKLEKLPHWRGCR